MEKGKNGIPTKIRTPVIKSKHSFNVFKENAILQRTIAKSLNSSVGTVNKIIKSDLETIKTKKYDVHCLKPKHNFQRKTMCRLSYENYLAGEKWRYIVTADEVWIYLSDCNGKKIWFGTHTIFFYPSYVSSGHIAIVL